jgi:NADH-ubiquinone oxidoreductase chain 5
MNEVFSVRFHLLVIAFVKSMILLIVSPNIFSVILGWDGLGVTSFLLVVYFQSKKSFNAGIITALTNRVGDVLLLIGIAYLRISLRWEFWTSGLSNFNLMAAASFIFIVAGITKRAQIPFSSWLPAAIAAPTPVSALVHSSTLVTAGVYLIIRFSPIISFKEFLLLIGILTIFIARFSALTETDIKKIVALSTLRQLGLIFVAVGANIRNYAFFHLLVHAYFKAVMFIAVGNSIHLRRDYQDLRKLRLTPALARVSFSVVFLSNIRLIGMPFISGFFSKDLIIEQMANNAGSLIILILIVTSVLFTALYAIRFIILVYFNRQSFTVHKTRSEFSEDFFMSVRILRILAIAGGSLLRSSLLMPDSLNTLIELKLFVLRLITLGVFWIACKVKLSNDRLAHSLGSMFSLPFISTQLRLLLRKTGRAVLINQDKSWTGDFLVLRVSSNTKPLRFLLVKDEQLFYLLISFISVFILLFFFYLFSISVYLFAK